MTGSTGRARTRDGTQITYLTLGARTAPHRLALVHSLAMDHRFWLPVARRLADRAQILLVDARGHGASDKPAGPYTAEQFGDDLADVMTAIGWTRAVVGGASMGGCVALGFAARHPERTAGLALVDTTAWYGPTAPADWADRAEKAKTQGLAALVQFQSTRWFADAFRAAQPAVLKESIDTFLANDVAAYVETCRMLGAADLRAALPSFSMPTAVIVGEEDYATPVAMAQYLADHIRGATLAVLPKARHLTPLEAPEAVAAAIGTLLDRVPA